MICRKIDEKCVNCGKADKQYCTAILDIEDLLKMPVELQLRCRKTGLQARRVMEAYQLRYPHVPVGCATCGGSKKKGKIKDQ